MKSITVYRGAPTAWVRISGEDAPEFLQSQFSNEIGSSRAGDVIYGLWLNRKGRVIADSFLLTGQKNVFYALSYFCSATDVIAKLSENIIADDVDLQDMTSGVSMVSWWGPGAEAMLEASDLSVPEDGVFIDSPFGLLFRGRRSAGANFDLLGVPAARSQFEAFLGRQADAFEIACATDEMLHGARINAGIAAVPQDIGAGELPQEGALDRDAVSFSKGCYLGQEVMSRIHSIGRPRRGLFVVKGDLDATPSDGARELFAGGKSVGQLRSVGLFEGGTLGHALLKLDSVRGVGGLSFASDGPEEVTL